MIVINRQLALPEREISFTFARSGGPGGQNVNKVSTQATLRFNVDQSPTLTEYQKRKILAGLANRINRQGELQVVAGEHRTQKANREEALQRFASLLAGALAERKPRKRTRVPAGAKERRLRAKKRKGRLKAERSQKDFER